VKSQSSNVFIHSHPLCLGTLGQIGPKALGSRAGSGTAVASPSAGHSHPRPCSALFLSQSLWQLCPAVGFCLACELLQASSEISVELPDPATLAVCRLQGQHVCTLPALTACALWNSGHSCPHGNRGRGSGAEA
jgi:hypothetical protein